MEKTVPVGAKSQSQAQLCFPPLPLVAPLNTSFCFVEIGAPAPRNTVKLTIV